MSAAAGYKDSVRQAAASATVCKTKESARRLRIRASARTGTVARSSGRDEQPGRRAMLLPARACAAPPRRCARRAPRLAFAFAARGVAAAAAGGGDGGLAGVLGGQVSVGGIAGFAVGYGSKRVGQLLMVLLGCEIVALQLMAKRGWVDVRWNNIVRDISPHVEKEGLDRVLHTVRFKIPFAGAFTAGLYAGLRYT